jgi:branched-chain amino acid transport system substrate-binding protein
MKRAICVIAIAAVSVCLGAARAAEEADIVIGTSVVLSGINARTGQEQLRGLQLWVEEVNARGGLLGRNVRLVHYDDGGDAEAGARSYDKLIVEDKAVMLVGPYSSDVTLAVAAVAEKHEVPMIVPGAVTRTVWERGYKNVFGLYTPADAYLDHVLAFAKSRGLRRVALVYQNTTFPREMADGVKIKVGALGMRIVFEEAYDKNATDFGAIIGKIKLKRPDVIIAGSYLPDSVAFMRQAKDNKLSAKVMAFAVGPGLPDFGKSLGPDAEGAMGGTPWEPTLKVPGAAEFARRYKVKVGHEPGYHAAGGYAAGQVLAAAAKRAGSVEPERLRNALLELDAVTILGRYKVDKSGRQIGKAGYVVQWINGERVLVLPQDVATAKIVYPFKSWAKR